MLRVGLTGGIGVGKTVCAQIFTELGVSIYNSDTEAKRLMREDIRIVTAIKDLFGSQSYDQDGTLNRSYLAQQIFNSKELLSKMNAIVHPAVRQDFVEWSIERELDGAPYVLQESALLIEIGALKTFDKMILVHAPEALRIQRVMSRDQVTEEQVRARMSKQRPQEEKLQLADYVIHNDGQSSIIRQVIDIHLNLI